MGKSEFWQSPFSTLAGTFPEGLSEVPFCTQVNLRGNPDDPAFISGAEAALGFTLPLNSGQVSSKGTIKALWLGPDEWLVVSTGEMKTTFKKLQKLAENMVVSVIDVGANRVILAVSGEHKYDVLMKSCEMDFHPSIERGLMFRYVRDGLTLITGK